MRALKVAIRSSKTNSINILVAAAGKGGSTFVTQVDEANVDKNPAPPARSVANFDINAKGFY